MPPYGIDSLRNRNFDAEGFFESPVESLYDPAFGNLNYRTAYGPAPYTGNIPLTSYRVEPGIEYLSGDGTLRNLGFTGDIDLPFFGGSGNPRFNQYNSFESTGIMKQAQPFEFLSSAYEDQDEDAEQVDYLPGQKPSGIAKLFEFLGNIPTPFNLVRRGLESLRGSESLSDFRNSRTGAEFFKRRRDREALARDPNIFQDARDITARLERDRSKDARPDRNRSSVTTSSAARSRGVGGGGYTASDSTRESYRGR